MNCKLTALALVSTLILCGCSTGYHKSNFLGNGYKQMRLNSDAYMVEYSSNSWTGHGKNFKHALRRAAELTKQNGYQYFVVTNTADISSSHKDPLVATTNSDTSGKSITRISGGEDNISPGVRLTIRMLKNNVADAYEADTILGNF